jgi:hypothetical protein
MAGVSSTVADYFSAHPEFEKCRRMRRHGWPFRGHLTKLKGGLWQEFFVCEDCGGELTKVFNNVGAVVERKMAYPDGYLLIGERIEPEDLNLLRIADYKERVRNQKRAAEALREQNADAA